LRELCPNQQRLDAARCEEAERRKEVEEPDPLVIDGRQPAEEARAFFPDPFEPVDALPRAWAEDVDGYLSPSR